MVLRECWIVSRGQVLKLRGRRTSNPLVQKKSPLLRRPNLRLLKRSTFAQRRNALLRRLQTRTSTQSNQTACREGPATRLKQLIELGPFQQQSKLSLIRANLLSAHPPARSSGLSIRHPGPT